MCKCNGKGIYTVPGNPPQIVKCSCGSLDKSRTQARKDQRKNDQNKNPFSKKKKR